MRTGLATLALSLASVLGCVGPSESPATPGPAIPFISFAGAGGWVVGEIDGEPFVSVDVENDAGPAQRFPDCGTQTLSFSMRARDAAHREIDVLGDLRFFEADELHPDAEIVVGDFWDWGIPYTNPPPGGVLLQVYFDLAERDWEGAGAELRNVDLVRVCDLDGACRVRLEIEGGFTFQGVNDLFGQHRSADLDIGIGFDRIESSRETTIVRTEMCSPPPT